MNQDWQRLIQISDTHILSDPEARFVDVDSAATLAEILLELQQQESLDAILLSGDLVQEPEPAAYRHLARILARLPIPVACLPGNHDHPATLRDCSDSALTLPGTLSLRAWQVILLDSSVAGQHGGALRQAELERLEEQLCADHRPAIIALHHPPVPIGSPWLDAMRLANPEALFSVTDRNPQVRVITWGHIHQSFASERNGVRLLACPSTCVQFLPGSDRFAVDSLPPGYRWFELGDDGSLDTGVCYLDGGRPADQGR